MSNSPFMSRYLTELELSNSGFKFVGKNVMVHENINIHGIENISIGNNVRIDPYTSLIATGLITIGSYIHIGSYCYLSGGESIVMEDFSGLSQGVKLYTRSDDYSGEYLTNPTVPSQYTNIEKGAITLRKHVIVGSGSVILPGVTVGEGSAVGALSLVNKSLPEWGIFTGVPARKLKDRSKNLLKHEEALLFSHQG